MAEDTTTACGTEPTLDTTAGDPGPPLDPKGPDFRQPGPTCEGPPPSGPVSPPPPHDAPGGSAVDTEPPGVSVRAPPLGLPDGNFKFTSQERGQQVRRLSQAKKKAKLKNEALKAEGVDLELATSAGMRDHLIRRLRDDPDDVQARRDLMDLCGMKKSIGSGEVMRMTNLELDNLIYDWILPALAPYGVMKYVVPKEYQADYKEYLRKRNEWRDRELKKKSKAKRDARLQTS